MCMCSSNSKPPTYQTVMRILGIFMIVISFGEIGLGAYIYRFMKNVHLGGWWGVIFVFISGILGLVSNNRDTVSAGFFVSILGIFSTIISAVIDGMAASVFSNLISCENTSTGKVYGSDDDVMQSNLAICIHDTHEDDPSHECVCSDKEFCGYYQLSDTHNCGLILTTYANSLIASTVLIGLCFILVLAYAVVSFMSSARDKPPPSVPIPVNVEADEPVDSNAIEVEEEEEPEMKAIEDAPRISNDVEEGKIDDETPVPKGNSPMELMASNSIVLHEDNSLYTEKVKF